MGGPMLTKYAAEVTAEEDEDVRDKQNSTGGRVAFLNDVWLNITKKICNHCTDVPPVVLYINHYCLQLSSQRKPIVTGVSWKKPNGSNRSK
ncbi:hypothetical protein JG688_00015884 [Phytophthora aleatoria]|uniref:Uncharacterized protein n=1 Tax=Phytophthora aleatoria TaxID=2496075 RepID=A0A8J5IUZ5_9STRA|nr:hypothetical protein JG688_00015884 [Phytophthora aleatoria]